MKTRLAILFAALLLLAGCASRASAVPPVVAPTPPVHHRLGASSTTPIGPGAGPGVVYQYDTQAFANSGVVDAVPGTFLGAYGFNNSASSTLYLMFFNSATVPGNGAVPSFTPIPLQPGGSFSLVGTQTLGTLTFGPVMSSGLSWAASTTASTLTVDSSNSIWLTCQYY